MSTGLVLKALAMASAATCVAPDPPSKGETLKVTVAPRWAESDCNDE